MRYLTYRLALVLGTLALILPVLFPPFPIRADSFCTSGNPCIYTGRVSGAAIYPAIPNCADSVGQHLNFNSTTLAWTCGTSVPAATGDVVGPSSSTDNVLVRFDGTTGKLLQGFTSNSPTCTDAGACTLKDSNLTSSDSLYALASTASGGITSTFTSNNTNTVVDAHTVSQNTSGTAAAGFGSAIRLSAQTTTTADMPMGRLGMDWTDATHATRTSEFKLGLVNSAAAVGTVLTMTPTTGTFATTVTSSRTTDLGWSVVSGANVACNTTCTSACVFGFNVSAGNVVGLPLACTDATADVCVCAGAS